MFGSFHFCNFVFLCFGHFSCVSFFKFVFVLNFCLAHLALLSKKVNKYDYVIFSYIHNFVKQNEKWNEKLINENLVTLLMTLCPPRVLQNFDDDQVLCVRHDKIRCFLWSRTLELAGPIDIMNEHQNVDG